MRDEQAFLRAIVAKPDDDLPRLAFADYLDEHGGIARAEFIRVQCELAHLTVGGDYDIPHPMRIGAWRRNADALRRREAELLAQYGESWQPRIPGLRTKADVRRMNATAIEYDNPHADYMSAYRLANAADYTFKRGFPSEVTLPWSAWLQHHEPLLACCPIARVDRAPKRRCPGGRTEHYDIGSWVIHDVACRCLGTGELPAETPDYRGDGIIRLTNAPMIGQRHTEYGTHYFLTSFGCPDVNIDTKKLPGRSSLPSITEMLDAEWKGVRFELPTQNISPTDWPGCVPRRL